MINRIILIVALAVGFYFLGGLFTSNTTENIETPIIEEEITEEVTKELNSGTVLEEDRVSEVIDIKTEEKNTEVIEEKNPLYMTNEISCEKNKGRWLGKFNECEQIGSDWCDARSGDFNECASVCRNDDEANICTMQCLTVCEF